MLDIFLKFISELQNKDNSDGVKITLYCKKNITANDNKCRV